MKDVEELISLGDLWQDLTTKGHEVHQYKDYEVIECNDVDVLTYGNRYVGLVWLSRHKTTKHMLKISVSANADVVVTTDHVCMTYDRDKILQNVNAKNLSVGDYVQIYDAEHSKEVLGIICKIEDLGTSDDYVYDIEVDDSLHAFYANDILVHNSQFINLECVSQFLRNKRNLPARIREWKAKDKKVFWDLVSKFVSQEVNPFVRNLVHNYCHTTQQDVLTYELEYMSDVGIYESKKHYATHKIFEEGDPVDKTKFSGIELKKAQVPKEMKAFLAEIYDGVISKDWKENDYQQYVNALYDKFKSFNIDEISFWKGYNTERQAIGFLQMQTGTTGIAKACTFYNQIVAKLGLGKKYEEIRVGDKVRFCYIESTNKYGINCIAYKPGAWPKEFAEMFNIDYKTMFNKIILDPLKRFREACHFEDTDPSKQVQFDIFSL